MLRLERRARVMIGMVGQSALGTGAAYVALLLVAYDRWRSPWAISLILLAEFVPSMVLGPLFGASADRWSRRRLVVGADVLRAVSFVGVALVGSFEATLILAVLAGAGTALFRPSMMAAIPSMVAPERLAATTSTYGAVTDVGFTLGPAVAAALLAVISPGSLLVANGATFLISAAVLSRLSFGPAPAREGGHPRESLFAEAKEGIRAVAGMRPIAVLISLTAGAMLSGGIFNVIELPFALSELDAGDSGYAALVAIYGLGFFAGSLGGAGGGLAARLRLGFVQGLFVTGLGGLITAVAPGVTVALLSFALAGFGNGLFVTYGRLLIQTEVPSPLQGRTFGLADTLTSWAMAVALLSGGLLTSMLETRQLVAITGLWEITLGLGAALVLRAYWPGRATKPERAPEGGGKPLSLATSRGRADLVLQSNLRQEPAHVISGSALWLCLLDDLDKSSYDGGVELRSGVP